MIWHLWGFYLMEWDVRCVPLVNTSAQSLHLESLRTIVKAVPKVRNKIKTKHFVLLVMVSIQQ